MPPRPCSLALASPIMHSDSRAAPALDPPSSVHMAPPDESPVQDKGKVVSLHNPSEPMSILPGRTVLDTQFDLFAMSFSSPASSSHMAPPIFASELYAPHSAHVDADVAQLESAEGDALPPVEGKGKGRELPPTLPPLSFTPTEFLYGSADWPSVAGPSSYGSTFSSLTSADPRTPDMNISSAPFSAPNSPESPQVRVRVPSRARSLSNLSVRSRQSLSGLSMNKVKLKAKKLFGKRDGSPSTPASPASEPDIFSDATLVEVTMPGLDILGQSNCFVPWSRDMKPRTPLATPVVGTEVAWGHIDPIYRFSRQTNLPPLRTKGRSYSSPLPFPSSPFDIVPTAPADIFAPVPTLLPNYFDEVLPHELKVHILASLVHLHQADHALRIAGPKWSAIRAGSSKNKWVGRDKGIRELFRLSRVGTRFTFDAQRHVQHMAHIGVSLLASTRP